MDLAITEARRGAGLGEVPVGAVLVGPDGAIMAKACNAPISENDPTAHAEVRALRAAAAALGNYRLPGTTLVVTLEPCVMCLGALVHARVESVVFGAPDPKTGAFGSQLDGPALPFFNHRLKVLGGVRAEACGALLRDFFRARRD
ncbi:CMP/dCMP deaminase zinc-binding protein [Desulfovibrio sp. X2]|uniref:tRNA adenosine(34) deaminase TadA n=1 Tax=Desulfovibrio sp. X2 TaxID=941449 RepID=UPI0003589C79|nr:tRNA adenosine(34) deaminase TadA [Desulfovibrio sp. X2]EPR42191.1 CMP/dCMP deaminase zinc-binding protein [Desulfovibrio sp. X2]